MKWTQIIAFVVIVLVVVSHGFFPTIFVLDKFSISLLFLLAIPLLAPYLKKAKWFGAEFEFREEIKEVTKLVQQVEAKIKDDKPLFFSTFSTHSARQILDVDPNLSLAALRIEIERTLSHAVRRLLDRKTAKPRSIRGYVKLLASAGLLRPDQAEALQVISSMCNTAVHGHDVTKVEASKIIELTERLNKSFAVGYSINVDRNDRFTDHGLICEWEHCVELFPFREERDDKISCSVFGHDCPGGTEARAQCKLTIDDLPKERFVTNG